MLRTIARWLPTLLLVLLLGVQFATGAMLTQAIIAGLIGLQVLVIGVPKVAYKLGTRFGSPATE